MSVRLVNDEHFRTTDHSDEIRLMREKAHEIMEANPENCPSEEFKDATILMASAALLECHDATGISLDDWTGPYELVHEALFLIEKSDAFLENGV